MKTSTNTKTISELRGAGADSGRLELATCVIPTFPLTTRSQTGRTDWMPPTAQMETDGESEVGGSRGEEMKTAFARRLPAA